MKLKIVLLVLLAMVLVCSCQEYGVAKQEKIDVMNAAENYLGAWSSGDSETFASVLSEEVVLHQPVGVIRGKKEAVEFYKKFSQAIVPMNFVIKSCSKNHSKIGVEKIKKVETFCGKGGPSFCKRAV